MSPIGRIFVVLNLVLAALFLGWAATHLSTAQDWKKKHDTLSDERDQMVAEMEATISELRVARGDLESSLATTRTEKESFAADRTRLTADLETEREKNNQLLARITTIEGTLGGYSDTIDKLRQDYDNAVNARIQADEASRTAQDEREDAVKAQRDAEEQLAVLEKQIADLEKSGTSLAKQVSSLETKLSVANEALGGTVDSLISVPPIDGAVLSVSNAVAPGLVAINKGSADGVMRGHTFDIFRGGQYKGRVRVENVQSNMCTAVIEKTYEGRTITQGDSASTRI